MLGWPTVFGHFHLWLKVGLYFSIEPESAGPHNSPTGRPMGLKFGSPLFFVKGYARAKFDRNCSKLAYTFS